MLLKLSLINKHTHYMHACVCVCFDFVLQNSHRFCLLNKWCLSLTVSLLNCESIAESVIKK